MDQFDSLNVVQSLMLDFADRTGLTTPRKLSRHYLWTDAFAVCNFLEQYRQTRVDGFRQLALDLIGQVHETLGRHRPDDIRRGWISGLDEPEGRKYPTAGGLRIGKALPERRIGDPHDDCLEWEQDGQYFHYLTKWMHALHRAGEVTVDANFDRLARELARTVHASFTYLPPAGGPKRMYWKMSIDLSRPLVASMGHHDPLDGLITYCELCANSPVDNSGPGLKTEIEELTIMCRHRDWATDDPLGLGGLLADACRMGQLKVKGVVVAPNLLKDILSSALKGLESFIGKNTLALPASHRLAFREFGLSIGLRAAAKLKSVMAQSPEFFDFQYVVRQIEEILHFGYLARTIEDFWLVPDNRRVDTWTDHCDINDVMLATSLAPEEFLTV